MNNQEKLEAIGRLLDEEISAEETVRRVASILDAPDTAEWNGRTRGQYWAEFDCVKALRRLARAAKNAPHFGGDWDGERGQEERAALEEAETRLAYYAAHGALAGEIDWMDESQED